jgi:hypothetical protein
MRKILFIFLLVAIFSATSRQFSKMLIPKKVLHLKLPASKQILFMTQNP